MANSSPPQQLLTFEFIFKLHYIKLSFSIQLIVLDFEICYFSKIIVIFFLFVQILIKYLYLCVYMCVCVFPPTSNSRQNYQEQNQQSEKSKKSKTFKCFKFCFYLRLVTFKEPAFPREHLARGPGRVAGWVSFG